MDIAALLRDRNEAYAAQVEQAELGFRVDLPGSATMIEGDRDLLIRAMENLVDNAVKVTTSGGKVVLHLGSENGWAVLTVRDTGIGIPAEDLDLIFERFHRGRNTADIQGSGLGLSICKKLTEMLGGEIWVESQWGVGSTFTFTLPLQKGKNGDETNHLDYRG